MLRGKYLLSGSDEFGAMLDLRKQIPEFAAGRDEYDEMAVYALAYNEQDEPSACGRLYVDEDSCFRIDYIGVLPSQRRKYMGDLIARMLLYKAEELNAARIAADVPADLVYFFARYGFKIVEKQGDIAKMNVDQASIRLEGSCSRGQGQNCRGDCANCS